MPTRTVARKRSTRTVASAAIAVPDMRVAIALALAEMDAHEERVYAACPLGGAPSRY